MMSLLLAHGARIDIPDYSGQTPLHKAARFKKGGVEALELLLAANSGDVAGKTASVNLKDLYVSIYI